MTLERLAEIIALILLFGSVLLTAMTVHDMWSLGGVDRALCTAAFVLAATCLILWALFIL